MTLPSTRRTWAISLLSLRKMSKSTMREKRSVVVIVSRTTTRIEETVVAVRATIAEDVVAEAAGEATTKEIANKMMVAIPTEEARTTKIRRKDLKLLMVRIATKVREIETEDLATTKITKMLVTTKTRPKEEVIKAVAEVEPTLMVKDPEEVVITKATTITIEEETGAVVAKEAVEVIEEDKSLQLKRKIILNCEIESVLRLMTC